MRCYAAVMRAETSVISNYVIQRVMYGRFTGESCKPLGCPLRKTSSREAWRPLGSTSPYLQTTWFALNGDVRRISRMANAMSGEEPGRV